MTKEPNGEALEIASIIVAFLAFALSVYQAYLSRKSAHLAVKPRLLSTYSEESIEGGLEVTVSVKNVGLGPAQISSFKFYQDQVERPASDISSFRSLISEAIGPLIQFQITAIEWPARSYLLPVGENLLSISLRIPQDRHVQTEVRRRIDAIDLVVDYKCLFETRLCFDSRSDKWRPSST